MVHLAMEGFSSDALCSFSWFKLNFYSLLAKDLNIENKTNYVRIRQFSTEMPIGTVSKRFTRHKSSEKCSAKIPRRAYADAQRPKNPIESRIKPNGDYRTSKFTLKMTQIDRILPVSIGRKRKLYLIEGVLTERWLHKMQDPNRFEVFEGALEPKLHQGPMENSPNHQIRSGINPLSAILRRNIQCTINKFRPNANWYCFERIYQAQRFRKVLSRIVHKSEEVKWEIMMCKMHKWQKHTKITKCNAHNTYNRIRKEEMAFAERS